MPVWYCFLSFAQFQRQENVETHEIDVRLQWDPDHSPTYVNQARKAIQLGLKGDVSFNLDHLGYG